MNIYQIPKENFKIDFISTMSQGIKQVKNQQSNIPTSQQSNNPL